MKVKLRKNLRYFESDDTHFNITSNEVKELPIKHIRSYSIKHFLFTGKFIVIEGDIVFKFKSSLLYIDKDGLYGKEYGKYFTKDLEFDTLTWIDEDNIPEHVRNKLNPDLENDEASEKAPEKTPEKIPEQVPEKDIKLDSMTKDELAYYATSNGLGNEIKTSMKVGEMRAKLKELLKL